jgi:antirestriction protein ArdC
VTAAERKTTYELVTERVATAMENGTVPWRQPWAGGRRASNLVSKAPYRGINQWLTALSGFSSPWWVTYKQAQALGGNVRKGEKGTLVVYFKILTKAKGKDAAGKTIEDRFPLIRHYWVFNVAQTEGLEAKIPAESTVEGASPYIPAEDIWAGWTQAPVVHYGGTRAAYSPQLDSIAMPPRETFKGTAEFYGTLFHEGVHATGAKARLNRPGIAQFDRFGSEQYAKEELIAEIGANYLVTLAGLEPATENSAAYLRHWAKQLRQDPKLIVSAASAAQKATEHILGTGAVEAAPVEDDAVEEAVASVAA